MAKIFDMISDTHESPNRNTFDLMHKRHITGKAGVITPFLVLPHIPSDSFEIDTAIGANLMPMWYPTQSNMRFIVHFFDVPYRLLQKDWKNMLEGLIEDNFPYMDVPAYYYRTGSLADYLGVPTTAAFHEDFTLYMRTCFAADSNHVFTCKNILGYNTYRAGEGLQYFTDDPGVGIDGVDTAVSASSVILSPTRLVPLSRSASTVNLQFNEFSGESSFRVFIFDADGLIDERNQKFNFELSEVPIPGQAYRLIISPERIKNWFEFGHGNYNQDVVSPAGRVGYLPLSFDVDSYNAAVGSCKYPCIAIECLPYNVSGTYEPVSYFKPNRDYPYSLICRGAAGTILDISYYPQYCPYFYRGMPYSEDSERLSAFPFRAYDMLYNSYYRNSQGNQPFVVDGVTKYNEYLRTDASGADRNEYELKSRNWELDAYTSCLPSPQQGDAPVVAVNSLGRMTIQDADGTTSTVQLMDLPDGEAGVEVRNADIQNPEHARLAMRLATSGLSIEDFRQGNALQRFLEQSLRSGYRYADFIFGHFGVSPKHQELDMPVFIGGYTQVVDTSKISNVSASGDAPLGQFAGVGASFGGSKHKVKHYCDDFGLIMGVMMLVPDPAYSQVLPKHFLYDSRLDFYFPEFSQLGMQPITYGELCPIQSHKMYADGDTSKLLTDTFGYQRPHHEYVHMFDSLHGLFRTSLNGSVVNRVFGPRPELGDDFLKIKPEEVNDIFSMIESNDDIYIAQVVCDIKATRPLPRVVIPSLGR